MNIPALDSNNVLVMKLEDIGIDRDLERQKSIKPMATGGFDAIKESIKNIGMNEPLVVYLDGNSYKLCDGYNRLRAIKELHAMGELPSNVDIRELKCVVVPEEMKNVVRYTTDIRQDLPPSIKAEYIRKLFDEYRMTRKDIAQMCGYTVSTIRNWLLVSRMIDSIKDLMDDEKLPVDCAVSISTLTVEGQEKLFNTIKQWDIIRRNEVRDLVGSFSNKYFLKTKSERTQLGDQMRQPDSQKKFLGLTVKAHTTHLSSVIFLLITNLIS